MKTKKTTNKVLSIRPLLQKWRNLPLINDVRQTRSRWFNDGSKGVDSEHVESDSWQHFRFRSNETINTQTSPNLISCCSVINTFSFPKTLYSFAFPYGWAAARNRKVLKNKKGRFFSVSRDGCVDNQGRKRRQRGGDVHFALQRQAAAAAAATWRTWTRREPFPRSKRSTSSTLFYFSQNKNRQACTRWRAPALVCRRAHVSLCAARLAVDGRRRH